MNNNKYGLISLKKDFPDNEACITYLFNTLHSRTCSCGGTYSLIKGRRQFQCSKCRFQIAPAVGTIFDHSSTPLTLWFHAILVFSNAKSGISAKQLQRDLEVTYKCAWRILLQIRRALKQSTDSLKGIVETDTGYFGGQRYGGKNNEQLSNAIKAKSVVMAAVARGGTMRATVTGGASGDELEDFVKNNIKKGSFLLTDSARGYTRMKKGYEHLKVDHGKNEYVRDGVHVNNIETWFSHVKRSMKGTFKSVSKKHFQSYLDAFVFHYNNRRNDKERFSSLLGALLQPSK